MLNEKQKKPFVSLKDEVTITQSFFTAAPLAQVNNAPNEADANLFCRDTRGLDMFFLASIVTSAFGAQSINYFDNTNSELTC